MLELRLLGCILFRVFGVYRSRSNIFLDTEISWERRQEVMADREKTAQEGRGSSWDMGECMAMMEKMRSQMEGVCDCSGMMAQAADEELDPGEWLAAMSEMMRSCCTPQTEKAAAEKEESHE
jgi:hypothetical protein